MIVDWEAIARVAYEEWASNLPVSNPPQIYPGWFLMQPAIQAAWVKAVQIACDTYSAAVRA